MARLTTVYTAESKARDPRLVLREMMQGVRQGRYVAWRLFVKDIRGEYARSMFGALWDFAEPVVVALIFIALYRARVLPTGGMAIPYPVFVVFGMLLWQCFSESLLLPLDIIRKSRNLITHQKIAPESLLLSVLYRLLFNSSFRIVILLVVAVAIGRFEMPASADEGVGPAPAAAAMSDREDAVTSPALELAALAASGDGSSGAPPLRFSPAGALKFVLLFPTILLAGAALGLLLAPLSTIYADVGRVVRISLRPWLYATPVLWDVARLDFFKPFDRLNPASTVIGALRALATQNVIPDPSLFAATCALLALILFAAWYIFHLSIPVLAERI